MNEEGGGASRSTDPAAGTSSATDVSLREFLMAEIRASREECKAGLKHLEESVEAAEKNSKENVEKALASIDRRFDSVNEFRDALSDLSKRMATQASLSAMSDKYETAVKNLEIRFQELYERNRAEINKSLPRETFVTALDEWSTWRATVNNYMATGMGRQEGARATWGQIAGAIAVAVALVGVVVVLANAFLGK